MTKIVKNHRRARADYRRKVRKKEKLIVSAPWGKDLPGQEKGMPFLPPKGWLYSENPWGRWYIDPHPIPTPYDYGITDAERKRDFPRWWANHMAQRINKRREILDKCVREIRERVRNGTAASTKPVTKRRSPAKRQ